MPLPDPRLHPEEEGNNPRSEPEGGGSYPDAINVAL